MNGKEARLVSWGILIIGIVLIIFSKLWLGLAFVAGGLWFSFTFARCPHCGKRLIGHSFSADKCPRCKKRLT